MALAPRQVVRQTQSTSDTRAYRWLAAVRAAQVGDLGALPAGRRGTAQSRLRALATAMQPVEPAARDHAERVARLSGRLALAVGLTADEAEVVALAGGLHDIGWLGVPPGAANTGGIRRRHPLIGAQLVAPFDVLAVVAPMIRHHHERLDGSGYPDGLRGDAIPVGARIIAVADAYDRLGATATMRSSPPEAVVDRLARDARGTLDRMLLSALAEEVESGSSLLV